MHLAVLRIAAQRGITAHGARREVIDTLLLGVRIGEILGPDLAVEIEADGFRTRRLYQIRE